MWRDCRTAARRSRGIAAPRSGATTTNQDGCRGRLQRLARPSDVFVHANESYVADTRNRVTVHAVRGDCLFEIQVDDWINRAGRRARA